MRKEMYGWIKIAGILTFIPIVLVMGPISGYILGDYLEKKFALPPFVMLVCVTIGFVAGAYETVKIIRAALKSEDDSKE